MTKTPALILLLAAAAACGSPTPKDDNALGCDSARRHIGDISSTFTDLGKGTITEQDALKPIKDAQNNITGDASFTHAAIQTDLTALADALGRLRVAMVAGDDLTTIYPALNTAMDEAGAACTKIGH